MRIIHEVQVKQMQDAAILNPLVGDRDENIQPRIWRDGTLGGGIALSLNK